MPRVHEFAGLRHSRIAHHMTVKTICPPQPETSDISLTLASPTSIQWGCWLCSRSFTPQVLKVPWMLL
ncbi:hypothetical protein CEXT_81791 [Caerostris extrusa]|uniref:Uncharacterized protein n=1 Tax=Caerostris extrusa TaxID=172846 RepID=A0AAV4RXE1_CAEEX|nr:hypothetical protein CEXT_81791 [Caerostris extrusa]